MTKRSPALATRAAVVATTTAAAAILATLPAVTSADAPPAATGSVAVDTAPPGPTGSVLASATAPGTVPAPAPTGADVRPVAQHSAVASANASALAMAMGKLGSPYQWGGSGPNAFDCSGLVQWAYQNVGVDVPRTSQAQSQFGTSVAKSDLEPGDLVFFYSPVSHVGIYAGDGQVVHASNSSRPVAMGEVDAMPFHSARRV